MADHITYAIDLIEQKLAEVQQAADVLIETIRDACESTGDRCLFCGHPRGELQGHVQPCERTGETREIDVLEWARENGDEDIVKALEARKA